MRGSCAIMVFRDQAESFRQLAPQSCDAGETWTTPVLTNMPDSRAKQSAGNLPGRLGVSRQRAARRQLRIPLAITLSRDGRLSIAPGCCAGQPICSRCGSKGCTSGPGYHYPKSVIWKDHLYVGYATNKEDVELTRVPLSSPNAGPSVRLDDLRFAGRDRSIP